MNKSPLDRVIEIIGQGKPLTEARTLVAEACGVTRQAVEHWERDGIPGKHVLTLHTACKGRVSMRELLGWSPQPRDTPAKPARRAAAA